MSNEAQFNVVRLQRIGEWSLTSNRPPQPTSDNPITDPERIKDWWAIGPRHVGRNGFLSGDYQVFSTPDDKGGEEYWLATTMGVTTYD